MKKLLITVFIFLVSLVLWSADEELRKYYPPNDKVVEHAFYSVCFDAKTKNPKWVMYRLTEASERDLYSRRGHQFTTDPMIRDSVASSDYENSGYDRGHLCPAEDMDFDATALKETFYTSNAVPQLQSVNRGAWSQLEKWIRFLAKSEGTLVVITGVIYDKTSSKRLGNGKGPVVPSAMYKIAFQPEKRTVTCFIVPNNLTVVGKYFWSFKTSMKRLESIIGQDFSMGDSVEMKLLEGAFKDLKTMKFEPCTL